MPLRLIFLSVDRLAKLGVGVTDIGETECRFRHTDYNRHPDTAVETGKALSLSDVAVT